MQMANQNWNGWKFQIHWDKLEWVNPRIRNEKKPTLCAFQKFYLEDNNKTAHWVGHSRLKPLDKEYLSEEKKSFMTHKIV